MGKSKDGRHTGTCTNGFRGACPECGGTHQPNAVATLDDTNTRRWMRVKEAAAVYGLKGHHARSADLAREGIPIHRDIAGVAVLVRADVEWATWNRYRAFAFARWPAGSPEASGTVRVTE